MPLLQTTVKLTLNNQNLRDNPRMPGYSHLSNHLPRVRFAPYYGPIDLNQTAYALMHEQAQFWIAREFSRRIVRHISSRHSRKGNEERR